MGPQGVQGWGIGTCNDGVDQLHPVYYISVQSEKESDSKGKICTLNYSMEELAALRFLKGNPKATQEQVAKHLGRSERTIKSMTVRLTEKEYLIRKNGKRDGWWEVLVNLPEI